MFMVLQRGERQLQQIRDQAVRSRVEAGIKFLDERKPGWRDEVDVDRLNIANGVDCVLGQTYGSYPSAIARLGLNKASASGFGFDAWDMHEMTLLTSEWKLALST